MGVSVIIPERANPELLRECLSAARDAAAHVEEPYETIVVANGTEPGDYYRDHYSRLQEEFPDAVFSYHASPLSFSRAIAEGLRLARHDWVYLLNNDMTLDAQALAEVMRWRSPGVFAVASQIFFKDLERRREETGWTGMRFHEGQMEIFDIFPEDPAMVRDHLYAGGGSSLYRKALLEDFLDPDHPYDPFYWEDVEWGIRAWKMGYEVLFCPRSLALHTHRATVSKFYSAEEVDRIFRLNGYRCQLRNFSGWRFIEKVATAKEVWRIMKARLRARSDPLKDCPAFPRRAYYPTPRIAGKPVLVVVSPFAIYPPSHGGAVRIHHLLARLRQDFEIVLVSDEADAYGPDSFKYFTGLAAIQLVGGRRDRTPDETRITRIREHCHAALRERLAEVLHRYRPAAVLVEFIELAGLIEMRRSCPDTRWFLTLHDVLLSPEPTLEPSEEDRFEVDLIRKFDTVIACSPEDAALTGLPRIEVVANGACTQTRTERSPEGSRAILFMGPFRYAPNLAGIESFLEAVFPALRERVPDAQVWVLGGHGARKIAAARPPFQHPGVRVVDYVEDVQPFLHDCAAAINPVVNIRGSSVKLLETLAAGRVCVSTADGARGFRDAGFAALLVEDRIEHFGRPLERLLLDPAYRHGLEEQSPGQLRDHDWNARGAELSRLIQRQVS
jgi:GT2 family glycosyltransferase/glycosyltransferase involved in cell wall biosynthesis